MNPLRRLFRWIVRAAVFFALLAFALNNQQEATLHLMFGREWRAPMTLIVLAAFALGLVVGVLGMLPGWRRHARTQAPAQTRTQAAEPSAPSHQPPADPNLITREF
jgi:uncharacterized integral membrane protein